MSERVTAALVRELLEYDALAGTFTWRSTTRSAGKQAGTRRSTGYIAISINNRTYYAHRLAWLYVHGAWPDPQIDHINRDKADNRIVNLRVVTSSQNHANRAVKTKSGFKGVYPTKSGKWQVLISVEGRSWHLGTFSDIEEAKARYLKAAQNHHGECACAS